MVGTPNQGSRAAELTNLALKNGVTWATTLAGVGPAAASALEWMTPGNPKLESLNASLDVQKAHIADMRIVGNDGFVTSTSVGDGLIPVEALSVGDLEVRVVKGDGAKCHYTMMNDPEVFQEMVDYFGWPPA